MKTQKTTLHFLYLFIISFIFFNYANFTYLFIILFIFYYLFIFLFFYYLYNNKFNNFFYKRELESIIKDKEFLIFKNNLINIYFSSFIILFIFLFKSNYFFYLLNFNPYTIYFLFFILFIYSILLSNIFILFLFNCYKFILDCINILNSIKFEPLIIIKFNTKINIKNNTNFIFSQTKNFSTYSKNKFNEPVDLFPGFEPELIAQNEQKLALFKEQDIKNFKKVYGGGYLGYSHISNFGHISQFITLMDFHNLQNKINLEVKIKGYVNDIPEDVVYSVLPVIRWQNPNGNYQTLTISKSIKITKDISLELIANKLERDLNEILWIYDLADTDLEFYVMSRPWLKRDAFDIEKTGLTNIFNEQLEKEISSLLSPNNHEDYLKKK